MSVKIATVVAVCPKAVLMPAAVASKATSAGLAWAPSLPGSRSCCGPVSARLPVSRCNRGWCRFTVGVVAGGSEWLSDL